MKKAVWFEAGKILPHLLGKKSHQDLGAVEGRDRDQIQGCQDDIDLGHEVEGRPGDALFGGREQPEKHNGKEGEDGVDDNTGG